MGEEAVKGKKRKLLGRMPSLLSLPMSSSSSALVLPAAQTIPIPPERAREHGPTGVEGPPPASAFSRFSVFSISEYHLVFVERRQFASFRCSDFPDPWVCKKRTNMDDMLLHTTQGQEHEDGKPPAHPPSQSGLYTKKRRFR